MIIAYNPHIFIYENTRFDSIRPTFYHTNPKMETNAEEGLLN